MTSVLERTRTYILEQELMDTLDLIQGKVVGFDVNYKINANTAMGDCYACSLRCDDECDGLGF
jgi:hypothetical protein